MIEESRFVAEDTQMRDMHYRLSVSDLRSDADALSRMPERLRTPPLLHHVDTAETDGSIVSSFEVYGESGYIERAPVYTLRLKPQNWEITPEGEWLRGKPENTWLKADWNVQVEPVVKESAQALQEIPKRE